MNEGLYWTVISVSVSTPLPGGFHLGTLPPAGLRDTAALGAGAEQEDAGLLAAALAAGGLRTGVEAAVKQSRCHDNSSHLSVSTAEFVSDASQGHTCCWRRLRFRLGRLCRWFLFLCGWRRFGFLSLGYFLQQNFSFADFLHSEFLVFTLVRFAKIFIALWIWDSIVVFLMSQNN